MNTILLKALMDEQKQAGQQDKYARAFNALEKRYREGVENAYGLESAEDWLTKGWGGRAKNIAWSRFLDLVGDPQVAYGRGELTATNPLLVKLLRDQGFKDAFQGAREAEMQLPDESDPRAVLNYFQTVREMGSIPYSADDPRIWRRQAEQQENKSAFDEMMKKVYGEKQGN